MDRLTAGKIHSLERRLVAIGKEIKQYQRKASASINVSDRRYYRGLVENGKRLAARLEAQIRDQRRHTCQPYQPLSTPPSSCVGEQH